VFVSESGNGNYYTNALLLLGTINGVAIVVDFFERKSVSLDESAPPNSSDEVS